MGSTWYPTTPDGVMWAEIDVSDPGHGYVVFRRLDGRYEDPREMSEYHGEFAGRKLGELLDMVTTFALGADELSDTLHLVPTRGRGVVVERADAADLLPILQAAVVLATAGTDRIDRVWPYPAGSHLEPLCVHCHEGSAFSNEVTISAWCSEFGHTPFGEPSGTSWKTAQEMHGRRSTAERGDAG